MPDGAEVRAPLPVMRDRLYGADFSMLGRPRGHSRREGGEVDAFRDFRYMQHILRTCLMAHDAHYSMLTLPRGPFRHKSGQADATGPSCMCATS